MKINILYIFWVIALGGFLYIGRHLQEQSSQQLFGIADAEGQMVKVEYSVFIQKNNIKAGQRVKKGDTLMVLLRSELDERTTKYMTEINQIDVERLSKNTTIQKDKEVFDSKHAAQMSDLQSKIKILQSEISVQKNIREAIGDGNSSNNSIKEQEIKALEEEMRQVVLQSKEQSKVFDNQLLSSNNISAVKIQQIQNELGFISKEKSKLVLFSPCDGFVEQVFVAQNEIAQSYKDLVKINPQQPNKIVGFMHESLNVPYRLGDTVTLISSVRPTVTCKALLVVVSPKLVELPFRLRRNPDVKAWGRELYINLPPENDFFIGEKIMIRLK